MSKVETEPPDLKAIRFHPLTTETVKLDLQAKMVQRLLHSTKNENEEQQDEPVTLEVQLEDDIVHTEHLRTLAELIVQATKVAHRAQTPRPNFATMSLTARVLEAADLTTEESWRRAETKSK